MKTALTPKSRAQFLRFLEKELTEAGIREAHEESERILEEVLGLTRTGLYLDPEREVPEEAVERSLKLLEGRKKRVPLPYLLGKAHFRNETLFVNEHVLVPRPETEILVEAVITGTVLFRRTVPNPRLSFLDIGTGSGAIAISLLREFPNAYGTLLDVSNEALEVARVNLEKYELQGRATLVQEDLFPHPRPLPEGEGRVRVWDLIVSNPPYLSEADFEAVEPELGFEPRQALDGGKDGLEFYRRIIPEAKRWLKPGGLLALEVGMGQSAQVSKWLQDAGYANIQRFKDYLGIERVVIAKKVS